MSLQNLSVFEVMTPAGPAQAFTAQSKASIEDIQELLGAHSSIQTTERYLDLGGAGQVDSSVQSNTNAITQG
jgi:hypothetical protein